MAGQIIGNRQFLNVKMVASTFDFNQTEEKRFIYYVFILTNQYLLYYEIIHFYCAYDFNKI